MLAVGLALCALWALAIFGAQPRESERHGQATEPSGALIGVLIVLALLVGIVVQHRKQRDD